MKVGSDCSKLSLKTKEEDKDEATVRLAAANVISMDAALTFSLKQEQRTARKGFSLLLTVS